MLPKSKRLNLKLNFKWVCVGSNVSGSQVNVFYRLGTNPYPKIGISVSSKVFKKAVDRNRAKRVISWGFQKLYPKLVLGVNIVAMPKATVLEKTSEEVVWELEELLKKAQLIKPI